jgi:hypothetical protein
MDAVRRQGVPVDGARERRFSAGPAWRSTPNRSQPASKDRFKVLRALCSAPVLPRSECSGPGKGCLKNLVCSSAPEICDIEGAGVGGTLNFIGLRSTDSDRDRPHPSPKRR